MKIWEYKDITCDQESLISILNDLGKECWELCNVIPAQKVLPPSVLGGKPNIHTYYQLIFKR